VHHSKNCALMSQIGSKAERLNTSITSASASGSGRKLKPMVLSRN
jgi:hypothetical protein